MFIERLARLLERLGVDETRTHAVAAWIDKKFWWLIAAIVTALVAADLAIMSIFYR